MDDGEQSPNFLAHESRHRDPDRGMFSTNALKIPHINSLSALEIASPSDPAPWKWRQVQMTEKAR